MRRRLFVKYKCGCIGLAPDAADMHPIIVKVCDRDPYDTFDYGFWRRDMTGKAYTEMPEDKQLEIEREIDSLIADGYRLRELASTIKVVMNRR